VDRLEARLVVAQLWGELADSEQDLLWVRFYEQRSQAKIAGILDTSQVQVSRLLTRLLAKLQALIDADAEPTSSHDAATPTGSHRCRRADKMITLHRK